MPFEPSVGAAASALAALHLTQLQRQHEERLRLLMSEHRGSGEHSRTATMGRAIVAEVAETHRERAEALWSAITEAARLQTDVSFTAAELSNLFNEMFEVQRSQVLEHSRPQLAELNDGAGLITATINDAQALKTEIATRAYLFMRSRGSSPNPNPRARTGHPQMFHTAFDQYERGEQIGEGGTGFVFGARNRQGETVAVKYLDPDKANAKRRKRFQNEIRFGQRARHPNLVPILDVGVVEVRGRHTPFYVMPEYPTTLRKAMREGIPVDLRLPLFIDILNGTEAAHLQSVWHHDLKPENILLGAQYGDARVADFGIAHFSEEDLYTAAETQAADRLFAIRYAAPEQMSRNATATPDHRADIFSLGYILYELFTGDVPHGSQYPLIANSHAEHGYLDSVIEMMIRARPDDRLSSIEAIKKEIRARSALTIAQQRLNSRSEQVVQTEGPDDSLISEPIRIIGRDWSDGVLRLDLSGCVSPKWKELFHGIGYQGILIGCDPRGAGWAANENRFFLQVQPDPDRIQRTIDACKGHIERVNTEYARAMRAEYQREQREQEAERRREIAAERDRIRVLESTRI